MLEEHGVAFKYREYTEDSLSSGEVRDLAKKLGAHPRDLLRKKDGMYKKLGVTGDEPEHDLVAVMVAYPTMLQRPIAILGEKAVICRPAKKLLELL